MLHPELTSREPLMSECLLVFNMVSPSNAVQDPIQGMDTTQSVGIFPLQLTKP